MNAIWCSISSWTEIGHTPLIVQGSWVVPTPNLGELCPLRKGNIARMNIWQPECVRATNDMGIKLFLQLGLMLSRWIWRGRVSVVDSLPKLDFLGKNKTKESNHRNKPYTLTLEDFENKVIHCMRIIHLVISYPLFKNL